MATDTLLWLADTREWNQAVLERHARWLGPGEQARCARFVRPERRHQFIVGRVLLRRMLSHLLGLEAADIALIERPGNAPLLAGGLPMPAWFSISHSGPWIACAAGTEAALGLDIERHDPARDVLALAEQAFGVEASLHLHRQAPELRQAAFYRMWCAYEARIKLGPLEPAVMYPIRTPGLVGVLACAGTLAQAPALRCIGPGDG